MDLKCTDVENVGKPEMNQYGTRRASALRICEGRYEARNSAARLSVKNCFKV